MAAAKGELSAKCLLRGAREGALWRKKTPPGNFPGRVGMVEAGRIELPSAPVAPECLRVCSVF